MTAAFLFVVATSCGDEEVQNFNDTIMDDIETPDDVPGIAEETLEEVIHAIPSPIEMTSLIKASNAEYTAGVLNDPANLDKYTTSHKRAMNLGVYGADLGYLNLYGKTGTSLEYLKVIKQLSEDLRVGQFFDFQKLKELSSGSDNMDSLITISTRNFSQMNRYLRQEKRGKISVLIVTGTFIEGLNIAGQIVKSNPIEPIKERIGEQKVTVEELLTILRVYESDETFAALIADFEALKKEMEAVEIVIIPGEPHMEEVDGVLTLVSQDESQVTITDETLQRIVTKIEEIRNNIIS